jgi:hypothetical protein
MKPHDWKAFKTTRIHDVTILDRELSPEEISELAQTPPKPGGHIVWARCSGCGAEVTTLIKDIEKAHIGWKMPEDCDETVIERIMDE